MLKMEMTRKNNREPWSQYCRFIFFLIKVQVYLNIWLYSVQFSSVAQSCLTLCDPMNHSTLSDPMDCSLPGSSIHGIFQAEVLEWVAIAFSDLPNFSLPLLPFW